MNEVTGVDVYNMTITGGVTMTISGAASDSHHIPCVLIRGEHERADSIYNGNDTKG